MWLRPMTLDPKEVSQAILTSRLACGRIPRVRMERQAVCENARDVGDLTAVVRYIARSLRT